MPEFIYAFHGGTKPSEPEEMNKIMAAWQAWMAGVGDALVNPGAPVGMSKTVSADGVADDGGSNPLGGFTIVKADSIEQAIELTKGNPHLDFGGTIEVAEIIDMSGKCEEAA